MTRVHQNKLISVIINASSWCQHRDLWLTVSVVKQIVSKKDHLKNCRRSIKLTMVIDLNSANAMTYCAYRSRPTKFSAVVFIQ